MENESLKLVLTIMLPLGHECHYSRRPTLHCDEPTANLWGHHIFVRVPINSQNAIAY